MEIKSPFTGRRGVSLPFTDYCQPIASDKSHFQEIIDNLIAYGKNAGWKYIEWRGGESYFQDTIHSSFYYRHTLDLIQNEQKLLSSFRSSTKRNIKKAAKGGVKVEILNSLESVKEFYRLNCLTRREHGLPPQPYGFFKKLFEHIISKKMGFVAIAFHKNRAVAGNIYLNFGGKAIYKYGASDRKYLNMRPNNIVMWEAIKWYAQKGFKTFSLGRTELENQGLLQFKRGWGSKEETLNYYRYDLMRDSFLAENSGIKSSYRFFKIMPSVMLRFTGTILYRHMG